MTKKEIEVVENYAGQSNWTSYETGYKMGISFYGKENHHSYKQRLQYVLEIGPEGKAYQYQLGFIDGWGDEERRISERNS